MSAVTRKELRSAHDLELLDAFVDDPDTATILVDLERLRSQRPPG